MNRALNQAIRRLLRPLVRYLINQGFTLIAFVELLKMIYVEEGLSRDRGRAPTDSDLSLMTGIHRKDIKRLRAVLAHDEPPPDEARGAHIAAQLIGAWASSEDTRDRHGSFKRLPIHSTTELSFETLTRRIKADMRPRAILDDLIHAHAVAIDEDGRVRLLRSAYVPDVPYDKLNFLADNVGDHMASAFHNLGNEEPFLERALYFDALPKDAAQKARPRIEAAADRLLQNFHRELTPLEDSVGASTDARRVRIGVYYYEDTPSPLPEPPHETAS